MARGDKASTPVLPADAAETLARTLRAQKLERVCREWDYARLKVRAIAGRTLDADDARALLDLLRRMDAACEASEPTTEAAQ